MCKSCFMYCTVAHVTASSAIYRKSPGPRDLLTCIFFGLRLTGSENLILGVHSFNSLPERLRPKNFLWTSAEFECYSDFTESSTILCYYYYYYYYYLVNFKRKILPWTRIQTCVSSRSRREFL